MHRKFPISDVDIKRVSSIQPSANYNHKFPNSLISENDFFMKIQDVAEYKATDGRNIEIAFHENVDESSVQLFLNGSVFGAILHQRGMLPFHGSSFLREEKGILICGASGVGKSSLTSAFCNDGSVFINDDITPIQFEENKICITQVKTRIKLWDNALKQLEIENKDLDKIRPTMEKFYLPFDTSNKQEAFSLDHIIILAIHNKNEFEVNDISGMDKIKILKNQIYRKTFLKGMPEREKDYFMKLCKIANSVRVTVVKRPQRMKIKETKAFLEAKVL